MSRFHVLPTMKELANERANPRRIITEEEQLQRFHGVLPHLVLRAREALKRAISYRNFNVGCALWAFKTIGAYYVEDRWKIFTSSNIKIAENLRPVCAEPIALGTARGAGYDRIIGMVIAGKPQRGEGHPTLHPCRECRLVFKALPEIYPETLIITILPEEDSEVYEVHTFEQLLKVHGDD